MKIKEEVMKEIEPYADIDECRQKELIGRSVDLVIEKVDKIIDKFNLRDSKKHKKPVMYCTSCLQRLKQKLKGEGE